MIPVFKHLLDLLLPVEEGFDPMAPSGQAKAQLEILSEIGRALGSSIHSAESTHRMITEAVTSLLHVERSVMFLLDPGRTRLTAVAASGVIAAEQLPELHASATDGLLARVLQASGPVHATSIDLGSNEQLLKVLGARDFLLAPLRVADRVIGIVTAENRIGADGFSEEDIQLLTVFAWVAALVEENATMIQRLRSKAERLRALFDLARLFGSTFDLEPLLQTIVDKAVEVTKATSGSLVLLDADGRLEIRAQRGLPSDVKNLRLTQDQGITGWVFKHGEPIRVDDVRLDERYVVADAAVMSELAVPLTDHDNKVFGVLNVDHRQIAGFNDEDRELLEAFANVAVGTLMHTERFARTPLRPL